MAKMDYRMNKLVSNIVHKNKYSHCRLCLVEINNKNLFLKFQDTVNIDENNINFLSLQEIINSIFLDNEFTTDIPGVDAICVSCANKAVQCLKFIKMCQASSETLDRVFSNIITALNDTEAFEFDTIKDKRLYLTVCETNYKCALVVRNNDKIHSQKEPNEQTKCMCQLCCIDFGSVMSLKAHNATYHYTATCMICYETFIDKSELSDHVRDNHQFQCSQCDVTKCSKEKLQEHIHRAHIDIVCKVCGKTCRGSDNLDSHQQEHPEKNYCPKCGKSYTVKRFYLNHVKLCLRGQLDARSKAGSIVKKFLCVKCKKSYTTESALRVHMRCIHDHGMSYECDYCRKKFTTLSLLRRHLVSHTEEKIFECNMCDSTFITIEALLFHRRRHNRKNQYSCSQCNEKFVDSSEITEHMKRHVNGEKSKPLCISNIKVERNNICS